MKANRSKDETINVLIVDDNADICTALKKGLEFYGIKADAFSESLLALEHYKNNPKVYDIILSDIRMPGMSGFQLIKKIKEINSTVRVILMSSFEINKHEADKVMPSSKVDHFIKKPIDMTSLSSLIFYQTIREVK